MDIKRFDTYRGVAVDKNGTKGDMQGIDRSTLDPVTNNISLLFRKILDYINHLVQKLLCFSINSRLTSNLCHYKYLSLK